MREKNTTMYTCKTCGATVNMYDAVLDNHNDYAWQCTNINCENATPWMANDEMEVNWLNKR